MKYFGTDGIRGVYGDAVMNEDFAYRTGAALAEYFGRGKVVVGHDTRLSGPALAHALARGIRDGGGTALSVGVLPTPAIAYAVLRYGCAAGVVVSASHNPPEYNGIKVFDGKGRKPGEDAEGDIERRIDGAFRPSAGGALHTEPSAAEEYIEHIRSRFENILPRGVNVALDCGNGAAGAVAPEIFSRLGCKVAARNSSVEKGAAINCGCGALYPEHLAAECGGARFGFAFDGDADRLAVLYEGAEVDGDSVIYNLARAVPLRDNAVVGTILNNLALERALAAEGKTLYRTSVGDKYICGLMFERGYNLGGEQSGHFIIYPEGTTGDGILSALFFMSALSDGNAPRRLELYPQKAIAEPASADILHESGFMALRDKLSARLAGQGRLITRMSGTEPKIRIMAEGTDMTLIEEILQEFKTYINQRARFAPL
jgi:phosphoglucosamine mutase